MVTPLVNIQNYFKNKSVKLSDSYKAIFNGSECYSCCGFTIPKIVEWNTEEYSYGNVTQKFLIPKLDILPELKIEIYESYDLDSDGKRVLKRKSQLWNQNDIGQNIGNAFASNQYFANDGYSDLDGSYGTFEGVMTREEALDNHSRGTYKQNNGVLRWNMNDYKTLDIQILNNSLYKVVYQYHFEDLRLTTAEPYELSYQDESTTKWTLGFLFKSMKKGVF